MNVFVCLHFCEFLFVCDCLSILYILTSILIIIIFSPRTVLGGFVSIRVTGKVVRFFMDQWTLRIYYEPVGKEGGTETAELYW